MTSEHSISVVVPCYNCEKTLTRAVQSVQKQTVQPIELILIDDKSSDGTRYLIGELQSQSPPGWLKTIYLERNGGAADARNHGWDIARGHFIAFLDADDAWHPQKLQLQQKLIAEHQDCSICGSDYEVVTTNDVEVQEIVNSMPIGSLTVTQCLVRNPLVTPSLMVRKLLTQRFPKGQRHADDHMFLMSSALAGEKIYKIHLPLVYVFKHMYASSGLNSQMVAMERSELRNYTTLFRDRRLSLPSYLFLVTLSIVKFARRLLVVAFRNVYAHAKPYDRHRAAGDT